MVYLMDYFAEQSGYWYTVLILIIITWVATFISIVLRGYAFCNRNPSRHLKEDGEFTKKCCINTLWLILD
jgi:hypothetical protein